MTIYLLGTSHVCKESLDRVKSTIERVKPDCVAVELDVNRYNALRKHKKGSLELPFFQKIIFILLQKLQDKLAKETGIFAGQEMLDAVKYGKKCKADIAFIDQNINITVFRLMKELGFFEKLKLVFYLIIGFTGIPIGFKKIDLNKVPDEQLVKTAIEEIKKHFPSIYKVLIKERDKHMVGQLRILGNEYTDIVAVVGAGHVKGIGRILKI